MELFTFIASLLLSISFLLSPTTSHHDHLQKSLQQDGDHAKLITQLSLARKLINLHEEITVKGFAENDSTPNKNLKEVPSKDGKEDEQVTTNADGPWEESVEEEEKEKKSSEYFTMDYGWVRRRRPIHNKQIPLVP